MIDWKDPTRPIDFVPVSNCIRVLTTSSGYMRRISVTPAIAPAVKFAQNGRANWLAVSHTTPYHYHANESNGNNGSDGSVRVGVGSLFVRFLSLGVNGD